MRRIVIENSASEDLYYWAKTDLKLLKKIIELIEDIRKIHLKVSENPSHSNMILKDSGRGELMMNTV